jgi:dolichol-phosphate mannosyltransferase
MKETVRKATIRKIAVVLFAYNEKGNLLRLLRRLHASLISINPNMNIEYAICVQGTDGTLREAHIFSEEVQEKSVVSIEHSAQPLGIRGAAVSAFNLVKGAPEAFLTMDCDLNHQPEELERFFEKASNNSMIIGSRFCAGGRILGMPLWKRYLSIFFNMLVTIFLRVPVKDKTSGYRLIVQDNAAEIAEPVVGKGYDFYIEFLMRLWKSGVNICEVPICYKAREHGISKMRILPTIQSYVILILRLFFIHKSMVSSKLKSIGL